MANLLTDETIWGYSTSVLLAPADSAPETEHLRAWTDVGLFYLWSVYQN